MNPLLIALATDVDDIKIVFNESSLTTLKIVIGLTLLRCIYSLIFFLTLGSFSLASRRAERAWYERSAIARPMVSPTSVPDHAEKTVEPSPDAADAMSGASPTNCASQSSSSSNGVVSSA